MLKGEYCEFDETIKSHGMEAPPRNSPLHAPRTSPARLTQRSSPPLGVEPASEQIHIQTHAGKDPAKQGVKLATSRPRHHSRVWRERSIETDTLGPPPTHSGDARRRLGVQTALRARLPAARCAAVYSPQFALIHGWFCTSPSASRCDGSLTSSLVIRSRASGETCSGNLAAAALTAAVRAVAAAAERNATAAAAAAAAGKCGLHCVPDSSARERRVFLASAISTASRLHLDSISAASKSALHVDARDLLVRLLVALRLEGRRADEELVHEHA